MCSFRLFFLSFVCLCCVHRARSATPSPTIYENDRDAGNGTKPHVHIHDTRNVSSTDADIGTAESNYFVSTLFKKYSGFDQKLTLDGFTMLLCQLNLLSPSEADDIGIDEKRVQSVRSCENVTFDGYLASLENGASHKGDVQDHGHSDGHDHDHVDDHDHHYHQSNQNADGGNGFGTHQQGSQTPSSKRRRRRAAEHTTTHVHTDHFDQCVNPKELLELFHISSNSLQASDFRILCPALIYKLDQKTSRSHHDNDHDHNHQEGEEMVEEASSFNEIPGKVWGFSIVAVIIISLVGLLGVAVIPIMQKVFYNHLLQLLVALAVGALSGDALLHLLPHALGKNLSHGTHDHDSHGAEDNHLDAVWMGLVALLCIFFFFLIERILTIVTDSKRRKKAMGRQKKKHCERLCDIENSGAVGAKLSAYDEGDYLNCDQMVMVVHPNKALKAYADATHDVVMHQCDESLSHMTEPLETDPNNSSDSLGRTHGHTHGHGHAHCDTMPGSVAAVAWMVILGDGIHNFSDGLAIGAAFASSITGGISTSIAVFCHELPHEIGDFAVLLRAGMSVKQAIVYNCVSSILSFIGMLIGVAIGNIHSATLWIFAGVGGMFLYISMVDMLPEMSAVDTKKGENQFLHLFLQVCGMIFGASIMLVIAVYEHDLQRALG